jgi:uncharacterized membrane protein (DUF485 family)
VNKIHRVLTQRNLSVTRAIVVAAATFVITHIMARAIIRTTTATINCSGFRRSQFDKQFLG